MRKFTVYITDFWPLRILTPPWWVTLWISFPPLQSALITTKNYLHAIKFTVIIVQVYVLTNNIESWDHHQLKYQTLWSLPKIPSCDCFVVNLPLSNPWQSLTHSLLKFFFNAAIWNSCSGVFLYLTPSLLSWFEAVYANDCCLIINISYWINGGSRNQHPERDWTGTQFVLNSAL